VGEEGEVRTRRRARESSGVDYMYLSTMHVRWTTSFL
jgi:hypothetical protein